MAGSYKFTFYSDERYFIEKFLGEINFDSLMMITKALYAHPEYTPDSNAILDLRHCRLNLDFDDLFAFVKFLSTSKQRVRGRCAIVTQSMANFGTTRMYAGLGEDMQEDIQYFENMEDALLWIEQAPNLQTKEKQPIPQGLQSTSD